MGKDVIIACDFDCKEKVFAFLDLFEKLRKIKYNCGKNTSINTKHQGQIRQKVS